MSEQSPSRVLIFHPALAPYRIDLFNALADRYQLRVVFLNRDVTYQSYDQERLRSTLRAECRFLDAGFTIAGRQVRFGISAEIAAFSPDVIVTHEFSQTTLAVSARRVWSGRIPHVVWTADNPMVIAGENPLRCLARRLVRGRIDGLVVYAEETAAYYRQELHFRLPIGTCPNAQAESVFREKLEDALPGAQRLVEEHGLADKKVLLYVGRLAPVKRLHLLVEGFAAVRSSHPDAVLVFVGDGPERAALETHAAARGLTDTVFAGHVEGPELYAWFSCGSALALTSEKETWGAVVNEALLAGLPVICSDRAGARVLIDAGLNGDVVDPKSPTRLAAALARWIGEAPPAGAGQTKRLRPSRMTSRFEEAVAGFCGVVDGAARSVQRQHWPRPEVPPGRIRARPKSSGSSVGVDGSSRSSPPPRSGGPR